MQTNQQGVRYDIKPTQTGFSVIVVDVLTPVELPGFPTRKCAIAYAARLKPIVKSELVTNLPPFLQKQAS